MKILLYEQWNGGHYTNYMRCLVPALARLGDRIIIAVNRQMEASRIAREEWAALSNVEFAPTLPDVSPGLTVRDRHASASNLSACIRSVRPDYTVLPSADAQSIGLAAMQFLGGRPHHRLGPIEGTLHYGYGYAAVNRKDRLKELIYSTTYRHVPYSSVNFVNFAYFEYAQANALVEPERLRLVGDPVPQRPRIGKESARRLLGLEDHGRYVGLLGSLDRRKAIPELLAAYRAANLKRSDRLLLAGRLDPAYSALLCGPYRDMVREGRIVVLDRHLTDDELEFGYEALDLATVVYYKFPGLASLALKAIAVGTPVIAHDFGWLRAAVHRFEVGSVTNVFEPAVFARALGDALDRGHGRTQREAVRRLLEFHSERNFVGLMTRGIRQALGSAFRSERSWDWVLDALPAERRGMY